jgi:TfoX/Sxy family transcriptional regulator of competence genes
MAWVKIPPENHPVFLAAVPKDPRVSTMKMFGGLCTLVNGNMAAGLWARSAFVTLDEAGQREALALDGAEPFDPMGKGKPFAGRIVLPETILDEPAELRTWIQRAIDYTATMPPKKKGMSKKAKTATPQKTNKPTAAKTRATAKPKKPTAAKATAKPKKAGARPKPAGRARAAKARSKPGRASRR